MISSKQSFYNFLDETFSFFRTGSLSPDLIVSVYFNKKPSFFPPKKLASNLFLNKNQVLFCNLKRGFQVYAQEGKPFRVTTYTWKLFFRDIYDFIRLGVKSTREGKYLTIMRFSFHLPLFYLLEKQGYVILHGSAVAKNGKAYLFLGGNQVGKTTIALNLVYNHGFKLLSDDYLLIKKDILFAFPDKIRVTPKVVDYLKLKVGGHLISSKYHLVLSSDQIVDVASPTKVFLLHIGPKPEIQRIDYKFAFRRINALHALLQEFPEYSYLSFLSHSTPINELHNRCLSFLKNKKIYSLQLSPNIEENIELILKNL